MATDPSGKEDTPKAKKVKLEVEAKAKDEDEDEDGLEVAPPMPILSMRDQNRDHGQVGSRQREITG